MAEAGGLCGIGIFTGLNTWCDSNRTGSKSSSRQAGCCPANFCGGDHAEDDFDKAERLDREAAVKARQKADQLQQQQMAATPAMSLSPTSSVSLKQGQGGVEPPLIKGASGIAGLEGGGSVAAAGR